MGHVSRGAARPPTIFHVTHYKAGSQWIHSILRRSARDRIVAPQADLGQFLGAPIEEGKVYPTVYVTREQFDSVVLPRDWRRFVVIRDLRDTLISGYYSVKVSHPRFETDQLETLRARLNSVPFEEGIFQMMEQWLPESARIQQSWVESGVQFVRYENLLDNDVEILERLLIDDCGLPVERASLRQKVESTRFERLTSGRLRGEEDVTAHERKGVAGDWRNHFSEAVKEEFKARWGSLLVAAGYEHDENW